MIMSLHDFEVKFNVKVFESRKLYFLLQGQKNGKIYYLEHTKTSNRHKTKAWLNQVTTRAGYGKAAMAG